MTNGKHPHSPKAAARKKPPAKGKPATGKKGPAAKTMTKGVK